MEINVLSENELSGDTSAKPARANAAPGTDPSYSVTSGTMRLNGRETATKTVTWGDPMRTMVVRDLSLGEQFRLVSLAGDDAGNGRWMSMAALAYALWSIDGEQAFIPQKKEDLEKNLDEIGQDGFTAYYKALRQEAGADSDKGSAAKNS